MSGGRDPNQLYRINLKSFSVLVLKLGIRHYIRAILKVGE
jgi:hypothetical protein